MSENFTGHDMNCWCVDIHNDNLANQNAFWTVKVFPNKKSIADIFCSNEYQKCNFLSEAKNPMETMVNET